jgi:hypothetical protein
MGLPDEPVPVLPHREGLLNKSPLRLQQRMLTGAPCMLIAMKHKFLPLEREMIPYIEVPLLIGRIEIPFFEREVFHHRSPLIYLDEQR